ncbi:hydrogenase large subunit [Rhodopila globiformis]|uniref:NADH-quinone oxidoreductase subunit D n=1 Tax=Rhodopila globiformis TaxID=1071 RepID=A0A2S6NGU1_RHOGL|nr:NADH-quinone oxidoreductase subunit C [Rhodopila globiformis]PPQ33823.1 NADH-quinone oxidoreductase subunit D [Rhodopila globiformis]
MKGTEIRDISIEDLPAAAQQLLDSLGRMQMAYACAGQDGAVELRYLGTPAAGGSFVLWRCKPTAEPPSLAAIWPLLGWYEREIMDLFGLRFRDHPEPNRLVLHANIPPPLAPANGHGAAAQPSLNGNSPRALPEMQAPDVQLLPFGPVRADVLESAEFNFFYIGEQILHYQPQLFYKHRGMEDRFQGVDATHGVILAERVSAVGSVAHALAFCHAVEAACDCTVPPRAQWLRVLLAELERLYNHLHYLGHLCNTTTLKVGEAQGKLLEERAKQINARLTGSRFLRSLLIPGGLRRDLQPKDWLSAALEALRADIAQYVRHLEASDSHLDRLLTTGVLTHQVAFEQGATGPVQRASNTDRDLRRDHPYAAYAEVPLTIPVREEGDAYARARVRIEEIDASITIMQHVLHSLPDGPVRSPCPPVPLAEGLGWAESPRGTLFYAVHFGSDGRLARVKIKSPSFSNWRAFPFTVHDTNMMDYAINEASFGLTISGCAR